MYYSLQQNYSRLVRDSTTGYWHTTTHFSASITTWCNSISYVVRIPTPVASGSFLTTTSTAVESYTGPAPSCSIGSELCSRFSGVLTTSGTQCPFPPTSVALADCGPCYVQGGQVQMYYFPVPANYTPNPCPPNNTEGVGTQCPYGVYAPWGNPGLFGPGSQTTCSLYSYNFSSTSNSGASVATTITF